MYILPCWNHAPLWQSLMLVCEVLLCAISESVLEGGSLALAFHAYYFLSNLISHLGERACPPDSWINVRHVLRNKPGHLCDHMEWNKRKMGCLCHAWASCLLLQDCRISTFFQKSYVETFKWFVFSSDMIMLRLHLIGAQCSQLSLLHIWGGCRSRVGTVNKHGLRLGG